RTIIGVCGDADVVGRYGGDEFGVLVLYTNVVAFGVVAERFREACEQLVIPVKDGVRVQLTVSAGAVVGQRGLESWQPLVELADAALYRAKRGGRNRVVVDPGVDAGQAFKRGRL
ncbi:MAG: GGDEF domain-containing protein, partial [Achromobacter sp.]